MAEKIECVDVSDHENFDLIPEDLSLEQYWEANNEFLNAWDEGPSICLAYRSVYSGRKLVKRIEKFKWYFHVRKEDFKSLKPAIKTKIKKLAKSIAIKLGSDFVKIYCDNMSINSLYDDREDAKMRILSLLKDNGIEPLESDLSNYKRYCIDKQIKVAENFRIAFFDIETDDRSDGIIIGRDRILSFAYYDEAGKGSFKKLKEFSDESEEKLLLQIEKVLLDFDIIITWNGNNFDIPYIRERFKKILGRNISLKTVAHIDFMKRFQKLFQSDVNIRSWSLNFISNYFLGDQKVDHTGYGMYDMWRLSFEDDPKTKTMFRSYNMHDCKLLYRLEEKLNILSLIIKECQWTGTFPSKFYVSELLDNYILRFSNPKGVHFRSTSFSKIPKEERKKESDVKGGFVYEPDKGLHENVYVFDFKSLYPTIVMTFNISQDTFHYELPKNANSSEYIKTINGFYTDRDKKGMLPIVIDQLLDARKKYKQKQFEATYGTQEFEVAQGAQQVVKELANCHHPKNYLFVQSGHLREYIQIEDIFSRIRRGVEYKILSYNFETQKQEWKKIIRCIRRPYHGEVYSLDNENNHSDNYYTSGHRFFILDDYIKTIELKNIKVGDSLLYKKGDDNISRAITKINNYYHDGWVYDISVEDNKNYYHDDMLVKNSMYGTMAQVGNRYYSKETAEAITLAGQHMNKYTGEILKKLHGYEVKYGDSVSPNTCIPVKLDDSISILSFQELFDFFSDEIKYERDKEIIYPSEIIESLSGRGRWKKVLRIIRHKVDKKIYDVTTPEGIVSTTEDHSFYSNGKEVSPLSYPEKGLYTEDRYIDVVDRIKLKFGDTVHYLDEEENLILNFKLGVIIGAYIKSGYKLKNGKILLYTGDENEDFNTILRFVRYIFGSESIGIVNKSNNKVRIELDSKYNDLILDLCGNDKIYKHMPDFVLDTNKEFVRGIFTGHMMANKKKKHFSEDMSSGIISSRSRKFLSQANFILRHYYDSNYSFKWVKKSNFISFEYQDINRLGYVQMANLLNNKRKMFFYRSEYKEIEDGYVYDIEIEKDHTFIDAAGGAILHNTDSVFVHMPDSPDDKIDDILRDIHVEYVRHLSEDFNVKKSHIQLEYEKKFKKIILLHKKQYVGWLVEVDSKAVDKIYGRGIEYVKKDTIELARKLQIGMLNSLLKEDKKVDYYHKFIQEEKEKFLSGNFDVNEILINMKVSKRPEKYKVKQVHIRIAEKMIADGKEFYVGSMIPFIITSSDDKLEGIHIDDYKGEYDRVYYWDIKIFSPLKRILSCVFPNEDWLQYEFDTIKKRNRKMEQFSRWLRDKTKAKRKDEYIERIKKDTVLSEENKKELLSIVEPAKRKKIILRRIKKNIDDNGGQQCQKKASQENLNSKLRIRLRKPPQVKSQ